MSAVLQDLDRHIFPRWRSFKATSALGELARPAVLSTTSAIDLDMSLAKGVADWQGKPGLWHGLDLLGSVIVAGRLDSFSALVAEVKSNPHTPDIARKILEENLAPLEMPATAGEFEKQSNFAVQRDIRKHRSSLSVAPRDAIEWVELARAFTIAGSNHKAQRAITAALQLAPNNRFVLRSAARFLIHVGDKEAAGELLSKADYTQHDPWLMASAIAIVASINKTSKFIRIGRSAIDADLPPSEITELASALGSLEAENGKDRIARRLLRQAVSGANENSVAQIRWLNRRYLGEVVEVSHVTPPLLHEATAWTSFHRGDFIRARDESLNWLIDQPFASAPAILSSFILSDVMCDYDKGRQITKSALVSNPEDSTLINNLAVCLMELGEIAEAEAMLSKPRKMDDHSEAVQKATLGKLSFRKGDTEQGRRLYIAAVQDAKNINDKETAARAAIHLALEEFRANTDKMEEALMRLSEFKDQESNVEIAHLLKRLQEAVRAL